MIIIIIRVYQVSDLPFSMEPYHEEKLESNHSP